MNIITGSVQQISIMENYIVGNARAHKERQSRLQLEEAYRETNEDE